MPLPSGHIVTADEFAIANNFDTFVSLGGCSASTTSASYADITGASKSWTKVGSAAQSDVMVYAEASAFVTAANTIAGIGVNINSVDTDVTLMNLAQSGVSLALPGAWVRITGVPAGTYTVKLRIKRNGGSGTLALGTGDTVSFRVEERLL